ncbi:MAG: YetF domain-containing protein, partial [Thermoactinomyces sp.]
FIPIPLIIDGEIIDHNLKYIDRDRNWLYTNLQAYNIDPKNVKNIILATYNQNGYVEVDTNELNDHKRGIYNYKPGNEN